MWKISTRVSILSAAAVVSACGMGSTNLRGPDGHLAACNGPHCVSSVDGNPDYLVPPLSYSGSPEKARAKLKAVVYLDGAKLVGEGPDYLHAEYTTTLMRYVDDVEFVFTQPGRIDLRSSSRIGYSDLGKNRERIEKLRSEFASPG